jgi:DNA invertase Pin-like site-specific DNA recombinase
VGLVRVGYIRTSKKDQNPELQRRDLLAAGYEKVFEEQISSRKAARPPLEAPERRRRRPRLNPDPS